MVAVEQRMRRRLLNLLFTKVEPVVIMNPTLVAWFLGLVHNLSSSLS